MNFNTIIRNLASGELSQLHLGKQLVDNPTLEAITPVVDMVNLGLTALYKRFKLKEEVLEIPLNPDLLSYSLSEPLLIKVLSVGLKGGEALPLNDSSDPLSCFTPKAKVLKVSEKVYELATELQLDTLVVTYQANHPMLVATEVFTELSDPPELELPDTFLQALLYFIGSRVHMPVGMVNEHHAGNSYFARYEQECQHLSFDGSMVEDSSSNGRLRRAGFA